MVPRGSTTVCTYYYYTTYCVTTKSVNTKPLKDMEIMDQRIHRSERQKDHFETLNMEIEAKGPIWDLGTQYRYPFSTYIGGWGTPLLPMWNMVYPAYPLLPSCTIHIGIWGQDR
jgi:hypothetical protein